MRNLFYLTVLLDDSVLLKPSPVNKTLPGMFSVSHGCPHTASAMTGSAAWLQFHKLRPSKTAPANTMTVIENKVNFMPLSLRLLVEGGFRRSSVCTFLRGLYSS